MNHPAIARRSLLTAAGCALLRPAAASSGHERLQNNTYAADIIVIGFGAAGASAAIEAARAGSSVLVLEKISPEVSLFLYPNVLGHLPLSRPRHQ